MDARRRMRQSLRNFKRLLDLEPGHLGHLEQLARISVELGRRKDAAQYLTRRARCLADLGKFDAALQDCDTALELHPKRRETTRLRARVETDLKAFPPTLPAAQPVRGLGLPPLVAPPKRSESYTPPPVVVDLGRAPAHEPGHDLPLTVIGRAPERGSPPAPLEHAVDAADLVPVRRMESLNIVPEEEIVDADALLAVHELDDLGIHPSTQTISAPPLEIDPVDFEPMTALQADERVTVELPRSDSESTGRWAQAAAPVVDFSGALSAVPWVSCFHELPGDEAQRMLESAERFTVEAGSVVVAAGDAFDGILLVLEGRARLARLVDQAQVLPSGPGSLLGLSELVSGDRWRHSILAQTDVKLVCISAARLQDLQQRFPKFAEAIGRDAERSLLERLLANSRLFRALSPADRATLAGEARRKSYSEGEALFEVGQRPEGVYLLAAGRVQVDHGGQCISSLTAGDCAGVVAALSGKEAAAAARAAPAADVFLVPAESVEWALGHPPVQRAFLRAAEMRRFVVG